jgi:hypothetical protein
MYALVILPLLKLVISLPVHGFLSLLVFSHVRSRNFDLAEARFSAARTWVFKLASLFPCTLPIFHAAR